MQPQQDTSQFNSPTNQSNTNPKPHRKLSSIWKILIIIGGILLVGAIMSFILIIISPAKGNPIAPNNTKSTQIMISAGNKQTCANDTNSKLYCWGMGYSVPSADKATTNSVSAVTINTGAQKDKTIKSFSTGDLFSCAVASDNQAYCWNYNTIDKAESSPTGAISPVAIPTSGALAGKTIKSVSASLGRACAIASDNQVYCWGNGAKSLVDEKLAADSLVPAVVALPAGQTGKAVKSVSTSITYACLIASDSQAFCWGDNSINQLGDNTFKNSSVPVAVLTAGVFTDKTIKSITTGSYHACVIASDDLAYCWGYNSKGNLGNDSKAIASVPVAVLNSGVLKSKTIKSISAGANHTCVIASDNQAYCWGQNNYGQLGDKTTTNSPIPVAIDVSGVLNGKTIKSISAGANHTCVIASGNQAYCWGQNDYGQLGNKATTDSSVPVAVSKYSL